MHIAFLTPEFPHEKIAMAAGIGTTVKNLAMALKTEGVDVSVFIYGQRTAEVFVENGIKISLIPSKMFRFLKGLITEFVQKKSEKK